MAGEYRKRRIGSGAEDVVAGTDARLTDQRTPTDGSVTTAKLAAAAVTDAKIAADTITAASIAANAVGSSELADGAVDTAAIQDGAVTSAKILDGTITDADVASANKDGASGTASLRTLGTGAAQAAAGNDARLSDTRTPTDGTVTNAKVAAGAAIAESKLSLASDAAAGTASRRTLGTGATQAAAGNDSRLSDSRTPTAHHATHETGGSDVVAHIDASVLDSGVLSSARVPTLDGIRSAVADVQVGSIASGTKKLTLVTDPTSAQDAATKNYADTGTATLTNKRVTKRIETLTDAATVTPASDANDGGSLSEMSQNVTFANPSGTPTAFQAYVLRIKSTTQRTLAWGSQYRASTDISLPVLNTGGGKWDYLMFLWNAVDSKWDLVGLVRGF